MDRRRLIIIVIAALIVLLGVGLALYFFFFSGTGKSPLSPGGNPFGQVGNLLPGQNTGPGGGATSDTPTAATEVAVHFVRITQGPVAKGVATLDTVLVPATTTATSSQPEIDGVEVRYVERASGNIYSYQNTGRNITRLTNKTLPGVQEVSWLSDGSLAFMRFLEKDPSGGEHVDTYAMPARGEGGYFLPQDLAQVAVQDSSTLLSLNATTAGSLATLSKADGTGGRTLFSSVLSSLWVAFSGSDFLATTRASANTDGYAFLVDHTSGGFSRVLGPLKGLTTLPSPSGRQALYGYVSSGTLHTYVLNIAVHTVIPLPVATLPEKCVWALDSSAIYCAVPTTFSGTLPDDWYQGATSFKDRLWKIDMNTRVASLILDPSEVAQLTIDAVNLSIDPQQKTLVFTNRLDGALYAYTF